MKNNVIKDIARIVNTPTTSIDVSLFYGDTGLMLLQAALYLADPDPEIKHAIHHKLELILDAAETTPVATYADGLAGVGAIVHLLSAHHIIAIDHAAFFEDLDLYLQASMRQMIQDKNYDPLHGAIGVARYFFLRGQFNPITDLLQDLTNHDEGSGNKSWWSFFNSQTNTKVIDLGAAHGMAGVLQFLTSCYRYNILQDVAGRLIRGVLQYFNSVQQDPATAGSFYSHFQGTPEFSRVAWCYGDLGILYAIWQAARAIGDHPLQQQVLSMLKYTAARRTYDCSLIKDIGYCHGSSGAGLIFHLLFTHTGDACFYDAAAYWYEYTTIIIKEPVSHKEFSLSTARFGVDDLYKKGLFSGIAGTGLFLLIHQHAIENLTLIDSLTYYLLL